MLKEMHLLNERYKRTQGTIYTENFCLFNKLNFILDNISMNNKITKDNK